MNGTTRWTRKKSSIIAILVIIAVLTAGGIYVGINRASLDKIPEYVEAGDYEKLVKVYNKGISGNPLKEKEYYSTYDGLISDIVLSWSSEKTSEEEATSALEILSTIDDESLAKNAEKSRDFILIESESDRLYEEAGKSFEAGDYLGSLKSLVEIDDSYTQYDFVKESIEECEEILIAQISYPTSVEEYNECQKKVDEYIEVTDAPAFRKKKEQLEKERNSFMEAAPSIEKAKASFDKGEYKASFDILGKASEKYPNNRFIKEELDELHNAFVVGRALEISADIKKAKDDKDYYDKALKKVKAAREIYDCDELESVQKYIREQQYWPIKVKNNVVNRITSTFDKWEAEDYDVKDAGSDAGAYIVKSGKKMALGDYDESDVTVLSMTGEVATSLVGVDMALDVRDLSYDVTHWG